MGIGANPLRRVKKEAHLSLRATDMMKVRLEQIAYLDGHARMAKTVTDLVVKGIEARMAEIEEAEKAGIIKTLDQRLAEKLSDAT